MIDMDEGTEKKLGTRVFKKSSPNNKITIYLGKRDFLDKNGLVDPIGAVRPEPLNEEFKNNGKQGIVLLDSNYVKDKKVFIHVLALFRYGRDDLDVLGLTFRKDLFLSTQQIYPPTNSIIPSLTKLQERLIGKLGDNAIPFIFQIPHMTPASVTLQPDPEDSGKPCGVDYELKVYMSDGPDGKTHKRNSVRLLIRKLTFATSDPGPQQFQEVTKDFKMCGGKIRLETSLDKEKYYHGESIAVNVTVDNTSNKIIRKIRLQVVQLADIMLFTRAMYKCVVDEMEIDDGFPISPGQIGWCKIFYMCPLLSNNRDKRGLALDGLLRYEDTNLASSTVLNENSDLENMGIIVKYFIRVRLILGFGTSDIQLEIPFILTHPNPDSDFRIPNSVSNDLNSLDSNGIDTDFNKLQFKQEEEFIFEDFARLRLYGNETNCEEA